MPVPADELRGGARLAAARKSVQQDDVLLVESSVELEDGLIAADEAYVRRVGQTRFGDGAGFEFDF